jgi:hypothetical protein
MRCNGVLSVDSRTSMQLKLTKKQQVQECFDACAVRVVSGVKRDADVV